MSTCKIAYHKTLLKLTTEQRLVVFYDQLLRKTELELRRILNFLELPISNSTLQCALENKEGVYKREPRKLYFDNTDKKYDIKPSPV